MIGRTAVLDHGYIMHVESWGSDERIVEAARMSTGKGFLGWGPVCGECGTGKATPGDLCEKGCGRAEKPGDEKLLRFLYSNSHMTPFEMAGMTIEVQAPIFVFREWHRHRTQSYNEASARYAPLPDVNYVPSVDRLLLGGGHLTKQAGTLAGAGVLDSVGAEAFRRKVAARYAQLEEDYQSALTDGVPKELARIILPVGRYSKMRASANLRNWLAFITLRADPAAQWEIRQYAVAVGELLAESFPRTWSLFAEGRL
jgi:thymidylate synthase (FAD)